MFSNHNLRADLQEWKNRLSRAVYNQFGAQLKYFFQNVDGNKQLKGLIYEAIINYPFSDDELNKLIKGDSYHLRKMRFDNSSQQASFCYRFLTFYIINVAKDYNLHEWNSFKTGNFEEVKEDIIENYISPILYFFHNKLDKSNSTVYLLEKYKRRIEWFTKNDLLAKYMDATKNFEDILEHDLRLFLFDQGIDYPFSTPKSSQGKRADIVGAIDTKDPIIIEVKIVDKEKTYGKTRIKEGFNQILQYTNDYNKDAGYLVIFNFDKAEVNFKLKESSKVFPPMMVVNNKTIFFITINMKSLDTASGSGEVKTLDINEEDLILVD